MPKIEELHPSLRHVWEALCVRVWDSIARALQEANLLAEDRETPIEPMTESGRDALIDMVVKGNWLSLKRAQVIEPKGYEFDEVSLADTLTTAFGKPTVKSENDLLRVKFSGPGALISQIEVPFDTDKALAVDPKAEVTHVELGKRPRILADKVLDALDSSPVIKSKKRLI